jgi:hypothetical protein
MTDWDQITESIQNAIQAMDKAHAASKAVREKATPETVDAFRDEMKTLHDHLAAIKFILEHESAYSTDEMVDVFSRLYGGKPSIYRATTHYKTKAEE